MAFDVLPAIDVAGGRLARLTSRGPVPVDAFGGDPRAAAAAYVAAGARWLHVVDLDLAFTGERGNAGVIEAVATLGAKVQASGGVASSQDVDAMLEAGAARVVLGSAALEDRGAVGDLATWFGERLAVGVETDGERIRARGRSGVELDLASTLAWLRETDVARIVVTSVARVAALGGPDTAGIRAVATLLRRPVIGAAGIRSVDDLLAIAAIPGVEGAIVGRALLDGAFGLEAALAAVG
jgi:phosphoribosylanthranilate isomerase